MFKLHILMIFMAIIEVNGHISWLFPKARRPDFDVLNFNEYEQPCGGVKMNDKEFHNIFVTGRQYNLSWRMLYQHLGGMQINLLYSNGTKIQQILPASNDSNFFDTEMTQQQSTQITFNQSCPNCILQILKQAEDLTSGFLYASCADISIITNAEENSRKNDVTECQMNGEWKSDNKCSCNEEYEGEYCEQNVDCKSDIDCGDQGICKEQWNSAKNRVCYCPFGKFGVNCEKESKLDEENKCFNAKGLNSGNQMDFVSYGLFDESCYKQTNIGDNDFVYSRVVDEELEIILDFDTLSFAAIGWRPMEIGVECRNFPSLGTDHNGFLESAYRSPLHPMACIDMVWASVINDSKLHIRDGYSRDKHTPLSDELYSRGKNSILSAFGTQIVDRTIVMFRRAILSQDPADHSLKGRLFGIFAKGQTEGERKWVVNQAFNSPSNQNRTFYREDEFSYHGKDNRGVVVFEFVEQKDTSQNEGTSKQSFFRIQFTILFIYTILLFC